MQIIDNSKNPKLIKVYTSKDGHEFYSHADPLEISAIRGISAEKAKRFLDMNLTEKEMKALLFECKREAGAGDIVKAFSIIQEIDYRLNFLSEENSILDLVCIYFFLKDEDIEQPSEIFNKKKHEIFAKDLQCKGFFLRIGLTLCRKYSEKQEGDMLNYLEENKKMSERILRYIAPIHSITSTNG